MNKSWRVVVVGSGLAGLSCAHRLLEQGVQVVVLTPGYLGRDGATQRVHALAPWIVLNAPCQRGDSPQRFWEDLSRAGEGKGRPGLGEVFAEKAPAAAKELAGLLRLRPLDERPVLLPGNSLPRARRFLPENRHLLLQSLITPLSGHTEIHERTLAVGLEVDGERVCGVWAFHRLAGKLKAHLADAVVLACGGLGAVFGPSTVPRWCQGSGIALAATASALLHNPHIHQALPVLSLPPAYFPTTGALLNGRVGIEEELLPPVGDLEALTTLLAHALRQGRKAWVELRERDCELFPSRVRELLQGPGRRLGLSIVVHHGVGGVAVDTWGRTSVPGLYACGEAAGGVQGARRLLGTGLLEARVFGLRAAEAIVHDLPKIGPADPARATSKLLKPPLDPEELEVQIDRWMGPLAVLRPREEVAERLEWLASWPLAQGASIPSPWRAAIRLQAAQLILSAELGAAFGREEVDYANSGRTRF
ncbi:MAG: FAD-dependent oxidoreductase [Thermoanaerobaculaceae bacterium]